MLSSLRHHAFVCGDDQQHEIDAGGTGQHVLNQAFVAGDIDDPGPPAAGKVKMRESVVDLACGAYDEESTRFTIHDSLFALFRASTITVSSPGNNVLTSNSTASSSILLNTGGRWARNACSSRLGGIGEVRATADEGRCASGSDPPPTSATEGWTVTRHILGTTVAIASRSRSARSRSCSAGAPRLCSTGTVLQAVSGSSYCWSVAASAA